MPLAVHQYCAEAEECEEHNEVVEQGHTAHDDGVAVDGEQKAADQCQQTGLKQLSGHEHDEHDGEYPHHHGRQAPAPGIVGAEQLHTQGDEPLAERRMHHERRVSREDIGTPGLELRIGVGRPGGLVAVVEERPGVLDIKSLVEDERVGHPEVPQT